MAQLKIWKKMICKRFTTCFDTSGRCAWSVHVPLLALSRQRRHLKTSCGLMSLLRQQTHRLQHVRAWLCVKNRDDVFFSSCWFKLRKSEAQKGWHEKNSLLGFSFVLLKCLAVTLRRLDRSDQPLQPDVGCNDRRRRERQKIPCRFYTHKISNYAITLLVI